MRRGLATPGRPWKEAALAYLLLAPSLLIVGAFGLLPLLSAFAVSLRDWRLTPGPFVGLANYGRALLHERDFWQSLGVTGFYVLGTVPVTILLGYLLAEVLHSRLRGLAFYRTLFFLPYVVSPVAAAAVWRWILNPTFGVATSVVSRFGAEPQWLDEEAGIFLLLGQALSWEVPAWMAGPSLALVCITGVTVWHSMGFALVVLLAGLTAIPGEITEAARLDGARGWSLMRHVRLPLLSPTLFFLLIVFTIRAFQTFTQIYMLSTDNAGGPANTTRNITLYIYQSFYVDQASLGPGYGAAVAVLLFGIILALTLLQFRILGRRVHYQ